MSKLPALHFYPGDWKRDTGVQALEPIHRYVWFECLLLMHDAQERGFLTINSKPMSSKNVARVIGIDEQIVSEALAAFKETGVCGVREDGAIYSRRMVRDQEKRLINASNGKQGGLVAAKSKRKGSDTNSEVQANAQRNPEDESEDENENEDLKLMEGGSGETKAPTKPPEPLAVVLPAMLPTLDTPECADALARWIAYQADKHKNPLDETAIYSFQNLYTNQPEAFVRDVNYTISGGWKGICRAKVGANAPPRLSRFESENERRERERRELTAKFVGKAQ